MDTEKKLIHSCTLNTYQYADGSIKTEVVNDTTFTSPETLADSPLVEPKGSMRIIQALYVLGYVRDRVRQFDDVEAALKERKLVWKNLFQAAVNAATKCFNCSYSTVSDKLLRRMEMTSKKWEELLNGWFTTADGGDKLKLLLLTHTPDSTAADDAKLIEEFFSK